MIINTIKHISSLIPQGAGENLRGMDYDISHYLDSIGFLIYREHQLTDDKYCNFLILMNASDDCKDLVELKRAMIHGFSFVKYDWYSASSIQCNPKSANLHFVTVASDNKYYVTGKIIVSGMEYENIFKRKM